MLQLVMIPALCCDAGLYEEVVPRLSDLVTPRTLMPSDATLAESAHWVLARIEGEFIVMGTSYGGHVAREVALAAPERVRGMWITSASAAPVADAEGGRKRGEALREGRAEEVYQQLAGTVTHLPGPKGEAAAARFLAMARRSDPETVARQSDSLAARPDRWGDLHRIECPALLLWGREDRLSPTADGLRMSTLMPNARFAEIPDCGHLPTLEAPGEAVDAARHWLLASGLARL